MSKNDAKKWYAKTEKDIVWKKDTVEIPHANLLPGSWRNFSGRNDSGYNGQGRRKFNVKLNDMPEIEQKLYDIGYSIKIREPNPEVLAKDPTAQPLRHIEIQINCPGDHDDNPKWKPEWDSQIFVETSKGINPVPLNKNNIHMLDKADIVDVDLVVKPYTWHMFPEKDGRIPYGYRPIVDKMVVKIEEDEFYKKHGIDVM